MNLNQHLRITVRALRNWFFAQLQDSVAVGVMWFLGLHILHVPGALFWASLAALLQLVPHFGPILASLGPAITAAVHGADFSHFFYVLILYAIIAVLDGLVLQPYIMRRTAKVPIWASILVPLVLGFVIPFWGVLLAPPVLAVIFAYKAIRRS